jgi:hypothetical protein
MERLFSNAQMEGNKMNSQNYRLLFKLPAVQKRAKTFTLTIVCIASAFAVTAHAQTNAPAVSGFNGKLDYAGGNMDSHEGNVFDASFTLPVTHQTGFQADGLYSRVSDFNFYGGGGHVFWRDPNIGLLGLTGGYLYRTGVDTYQVGAEGEYYLGRFTFGAFAGVGSINYANPAPFIDTNPTRFVGRISADYYPLNDLRIGASYTTAFRENLAKGELEYQTPIRGLALTAEVSGGSYGYHDYLFGIRYYFGGKKTLRDRQRQDDPPGLMRQILSGMGLYGAEFNHKGNEYLLAHPGSGSLGGGYGLGMFPIGSNPPPF